MFITGGAGRSQGTTTTSDTATQPFAQAIDAAFLGSFPWKLSLEAFLGSFPWKLSLEAFLGSFPWKLSLEASLTPAVHRVLCLFLPRCHRPSPNRDGRLPAYVPRITTSREAIFEVAGIP
jgi:hypothetical protein